MPYGLPNVSYLGFPAPSLAPAHAGLGFREARPADLRAVADHFARLTPDCRRRRFCATLGPAAIEAHAARLWDRAGLTLAAVDGPLWPGALHAAGSIRALAEIAVDGRDAEIGLSVEDALRRRGIATYLTQAAAWVLAPRGVRRLVACTTADNAAMVRLGLRAGAAIERSAADVEISFDVAVLRRAYLRRRLTERVFALAG